jgi:hypothetical protein
MKYTLDDLKRMDYFHGVRGKSIKDLQQMAKLLGIKGYTKFDKITLMNIVSDGIKRLQERN